jgi:hypothetical protein
MTIRQCSWRDRAAGCVEVNCIAGDEVSWRKASALRGGRGLGESGLSSQGGSRSFSLCCWEAIATQAIGC